MANPEAKKRCLTIVRNAHAEYKRADKALLLAVQSARRYGCAWDLIGDQMGTSRQTVWERFAAKCGPPKKVY